MQTKRMLIATLAVLLPLAGVHAAETGQDERFVVITNATVIPIEGKEQKKATIVISDGKITNIGPSIEYPRNARVIDAEGMTVMPGLMLAHSRAGLPGFSRRGINSNLLAADEVHEIDGQFDDLLDAGITTVGLLPGGGGIPGRAAVMQTAGEERFLKRESFLMLATSKGELRSALKKAQAEIDKVEKAKKEWDEKQKKAAAEAAKKAEAEKKKAAEAAKKGEKPKAPASQPTSQPAKKEAPKFEPPKIDPAYEGLVALLKDEAGVPTVLQVRRASDVLHMKEVLADYDFRPTWTLSNFGQNDLFHVIDELMWQGEMDERKAKKDKKDAEDEEDGDKKKAKKGKDKKADAPRLIVQPSQQRVPYSAERLPFVRMLAEAGCELSFVPRFDNANEYQQLLPRVAELVRNGLDRDAALKALTLHPAKFLGLDKERGSIKKDKFADLIFLDGDPLAPGSRVRKVMIAGEIVHETEAWNE